MAMNIADVVRSVGNASPIQITDQSILSELRAYEKRYADAITEFIWNAFDANASKVEITYDFPNSVGQDGFGYPKLEISDDGEGWDMSDLALVANFLDSKKRSSKQPYKSLPHGSRGVGRFTFYAFAKRAEWHTNYQGKTYDLVIERENISNYRLTPSPGIKTYSKGTKVEFEVNNEALHEDFFEHQLANKLLEKFAWFLVLYPDKKININSVPLDINQIIEHSLEDSIKVNDRSIEIKLVQWSRSLADKENSKVYFIDGHGKEVFKTPSGLNNKSDIFHHSAYVKSDSFEGYSPTKEDTEDEGLSSQVGIFDSGDQARLIRKCRLEIKVRLEEFRQPHLEAKSSEIVQAWADEQMLPDVAPLGVDSGKYRELIRETFVIAPNMYLGVSDDHRRILFNLLASLMGTTDRELILTILEQVYKLSDEQKESLKGLLERTTLENILSTVKEIEQRLQVIEDLDRLVYDPNLFKDTLEVKHLQQIINREFWVFGDEYRYIVDTEGPIRNAIIKWARSMLGIEDYEPEADSKKEMDLLISKKIELPDRVINIVVELKRPSVKLGDEELGQIMNYRKQLFKDPACTGKNIEWVFILMGRDYDEDIERAIESATPFGEKHRGLVQSVASERSRIYVRKWSELISGELRPKYRYLKDKLSIKLREQEANPEEITKPIVAYRDEVSV